ncbi:MAG: sulfite exporter TauE/SafE family protein [Desulfuromusa sp.]|nr:sulfite exporter TauE/SafE family protein [Desulfuromusa sp.]
MSFITDPYFYLIAIPAVLLYGMAKGGLGPGIGALVVPSLALVISPVQAAAIMLPILCVMDIFAVHRFRGQYDRKQLNILVPSAIVGIIIASLFMGHMSADSIRLLIGIISLAFCLNHWFGRRASKHKKGGPISGYFWGILSGFTSTQIHAGGPPLSIYLLPQNLDKVTLIGTMAVFFTIVNYLKLIPYTLLGLFDPANLMTSIILMPLAPVGVKMGYVVLQKVSQTTIYRFLYVVLFLSGIKLCIDGLL